MYGILPVTRYASDIRFFVDNQPLGNFSYEPSDDSGERLFQFNLPLFVVDSLPHGSHTLKIANGREGGPACLILLDYIVYAT